MRKAKGSTRDQSQTPPRNELHVDVDGYGLDGVEYGLDEIEYGTTHPSPPDSPNVSAHSTFGSQSRPLLKANHISGLTTQSLIITANSNLPQNIQILDGGISISTLMESAIENEDDYPNSDAESDTESLDLVPVPPPLPTHTPNIRNHLHHPRSHTRRRPVDVGTPILHVVDLKNMLMLHLPEDTPRPSSTNPQTRRGPTFKTYEPSK
ncbi:hypothetical protein BDN72DRAFT_903313 [Pluteus cervinus]|uniref:Uncharacterized protein n=1 Tax=Pluteus cervinus TaxID=181527 RepID=A0ACD3A9I7_9AGAR|nr:hypothetical protein BDN72DRAFT_903313 [Pluteus cervinus]